MGSELLAFSDLVEVLPGWNDIRFDGLPYPEYHSLDRNGSAMEAATTMRPHLIELGATDSQLRQLPGIPDEAERPVEEDRWYEVQLGGPDDEGIDAQIYNSLGGEEHRRARVTDIRTLGTKDQDDLARRFSLDEIGDAATADIELLLEGTEGAELVACYHVGQGGCSALCDARAFPLVYFDLGGGITANAKTYPAGFQVCHTDNQPIVLSHWDMDHWSTADRDPRALDHPWIVPRQKLGKTHLGLAAKLHARGHLFIWPRGASSISAGAIEVVQCGGKSRNNSGLAATASLPDDHRVLLPGDASYKFVHGLQSHYEGLIASHHGAHGTGAPPSANSPRQIAYSFGVRNTFSHPRKTALKRHSSAGWTQRLDTPDGNICLSSGASTPLLVPCGSRCSLSLDQP